MKKRQFLFLMTLAGTLAFCGALQANGAVDTQETSPNRRNEGANIESKSNERRIETQEGESIESMPDGSYTIFKRDGTQIEVKRDGTKIIRKTDGTTEVIKPGQ